jgi:hypothetical protein
MFEILKNIPTTAIVLTLLIIWAGFKFMNWRYLYSGYKASRPLYWLLLASLCTLPWPGDLSKVLYPTDPKTVEYIEGLGYPTIATPWWGQP